MNMNINNNDTDTFRDFSEHLTEMDEQNAGVMEYGNSDPYYKLNKQTGNLEYRQVVKCMPSLPIHDNNI